MNIIISNANINPIYKQIYEQIKNEIISYNLEPGEMLPSIRSLAKDLRISVITTKRAYEELERDGFINTVAGKGCYVAKQNLELIRESRLKTIEELIKEILALAPSCNLSMKELIEMIEVIKGED